MLRAVNLFHTDQQPLLLLLGTVFMRLMRMMKTESGKGGGGQSSGLGPV